MNQSADVKGKGRRHAPSGRVYAVVLFLVLLLFTFVVWRRRVLLTSLSSRNNNNDSNAGHHPLSARTIAGAETVAATQQRTTRFPTIDDSKIFTLNTTTTSNANEGLFYPSIAEVFGQSEGTYRGTSFQQLSRASPRAFLLFDTLSKEDCETLITVAKEQMARSEVVHRPGEAGINPVRTSYGMFIMSSVPADVRMRRRIADMVGVPLINIEATQILRYKPGQYYRVHPDYFYSGATEHLARGGQRIVTVLTWLNKVELGGETKFPLASPPITVKQTGVGNSIMFYSVKQDGSVDPTSSHEGVPPGEGSEKWVAVCWIRQREFH